MKNKNIHQFFSFIVALLVLFPFVIQATHALENHEHTICNAKDIKHIHQQDVDCSIYHTFIDNNVLLSHNTADAYKKKDYFECFNTTPQINSLGLFELKSPRAPPHFS